MSDRAGVPTGPSRPMGAGFTWSGRRAPARRERGRLRWGLGVLTAVVVALVVPAVSHASSYSAIDAGTYHTCAIKAGGIPACWGYNGNGRTTIPAGTGTVIQTTAGGDHTCAIKTGGTPACWGFNGQGQTTIPAGTGTITQITAGGAHTCAIRTDGTPTCWGNNAYGQTTIPAGTGTITQIAVGLYHTCAIKIDGTPACWGRNATGQTTIPAGTGTITQITAGDLHTCAIKTGGTPACWGYNGSGQTTIPAGTGTITQITAGIYHTCAIKTDGTPACWGDNPYGQATIPAGIGTVTQITAGLYHTCAIKTDRAAVCWGRNNNGEATVPPHNTARPVLSGAPKVGSVLTATDGGWDNAPTAYTYAWQRCTTNNTLASCTDIAGADQTTYTLGAADDTYWIRVTVTATNVSGATSQYSLPTYQVKPTRPDNTTRPVLTGTPQVGSTLTTTTGAWDNVPDAFTYAWKRCTSILLASCTTIDGADQPSYEVSAQDAGLHIRAYVTATNSGGSATAYTYPTGKITGGV